jgi:glycosyl transferase, family 25
LVKAFFINLDGEKGRRRFIEAQLSEAGIPGERIEAVDGSKPLPADLAPYFSPTHLMDAGALGCYASHITTWRQLMLHDMPYALVLEDDAIIDLGLSDILQEALEALPKGWDMVHLGTRPDRTVSPIAALTGRKLVQYSRVPPGTVAYLLSWAGAQKMLLAEPRVWPIDTDTRRPWVFGLDVYGLDAPPVQHNWTIPSTIRARGPKRWTPRRGLNAVFVNPIRNREGFLFNWRRLGPSRWCRCLIGNATLKARAMLKQKHPGGAAPRTLRHQVVKSVIALEQSIDRIRG